MRANLNNDRLGLEAVLAGRLLADVDAGVITRPDGRRAECPDRRSAYGKVFIQPGVLVLAHRLIWLVANGPILDDHIQINHKNGKRWDNRIANLELATPSENIGHAGALRAIMRREAARGERGALYQGGVLLAAGRTRRRRRRA